MEDRKLDAAESLALIGRMIENTRSRMVRNAGRPFLAWGYATAATLIAVWAAVSCTGDIRWNYLWFMLPLLGGALMYFTRPKATEGSVHTYVDRVLDLIWSVIGPATLLISTLAICFVVRFPDAFTVLPQDYVLVKPRFSAFFHTGLDLILRRLGVQTVLLAGTTTPNCIRTTCYDAISLDYDAVVLSDCTSSVTDAVQAGNLADMQRVGAIVCASTELTLA